MHSGRGTDLFFQMTAFFKLILYILYAHILEIGLNFFVNQICQGGNFSYQM